jgi:hypothetical protein
MTRTFAFAAALGLTLAGAAGYGDEPKPDKKKPSIMENKLAAAQKVLGGLAKNDFDAIKENAGILNDMSRQAAWKMYQSPRYEMYSDEFQRITLKMMTQAKEKNLDAAALSYVDMTLTCVKCHQHVREVRFGRGDSDPFPPAFGGR